jgi:DNA-binding response OmpR family regulator
MLVTVNLELEGFEVHTAIDGVEALEKVAEVDPHVITLDVMMPRLDGLDTAAKLRADPKTRHYKILMLSARAQLADIRRGSDVGADAYLTKPFDPSELVDTVRQLAAEAEKANP